MSSALTLWQLGKSIPNLIAEYDNSDEKAYNKATQLAATNIEQAREHLLQNAKDTPHRVNAMASLDKLAKKQNRMPGFIQLAMAIGPIFNQGRDAKADIHDRLNQGELFGYGYITPRSPDDLPVKIPNDVWAGKIDWSESSVSGAGLRFVSVRLVDKKDVEKARLSGPHNHMEKDSVTAPLTRKKSGRKSRKDEIWAAYTALEAQGVLTQDTPTAILGHEIRNFILEAVPVHERKETGLSDETIRRIIRASK